MHCLYALPNHYSCDLLERPPSKQRLRTAMLERMLLSLDVARVLDTGRCAIGLDVGPCLGVGRNAPLPRHAS